MSAPVPQSISPDHSGLACVLLVALVLRTAPVFLQPGELTHDRDAYLGIARQIAAGSGYCSPESARPTAFRPPLYPLLLAGAGQVLPWSTAVVAINALGAVLLVAGMWRLAEQLGLGRWRRVAGLLAASDPLLVQYAGQPMTESLFTGLIASWLACVTRPSPGWRGDVLAGLLFGLAVLCRPTLWPLAGLYGLVWIGRLRTRATRPASAPSELRFPWASLPAAALAVTPWMFRNVLVFGVPLLTTTHGGYTLLLANNPVFYREVVSQPAGTVWSGESLHAWQTDLATRIQRELGPDPGEVAEDRLQSRWARDYIREHPREFLESAAYRVRSLWRLTPLEPSAAGRRAWLLRGVALFYLTLFVLAVAGLLLVIATRTQRAWLPLLLLLVTVQSVHLFYWTDARMRAPLVPVLALLATCGVQGLLARRNTDSDAAVR